MNFGIASFWETTKKNGISVVPFIMKVLDCADL
jgi:hypothetical protein